MNTNTKWGIAVGVAIVGFLFYHFYWKEPQDNNPQPPNDPPAPRQAERQLLYIPRLKELSQHFNKQHPTQNQMIQLYKIIAQQSQKRGQLFIANFKYQRRKLIDDDFSQYMRFVRDHLKELKKIDDIAKQQVLAELNMSSDQFRNALFRYQDAFEETQSQALRGKQNYLSAEELRKGMQFQKQFIKKNGSKLIKLINKEIKNWRYDQKELIYEIVNVIFSDETFKEFGYDQDLTAKSSIKHKHQLSDEISQLKDGLTNLLMRIDVENEKEEEDESDVNILNRGSLRNLSAEPQFQQMMDAMHRE